LVTQAAKCLRDRQRRKKHETTGLPHGAVAAGKDFGHPLDVQAALARLSSEHREVLVLREFEQLSYQEMSDVLGVPQGTIESRLHRAREALKQLLGAYRA
jgi:RNA polymerase sigma-70 factor (ECF subfamily)